MLFIRLTIQPKDFTALDKVFMKFTTGKELLHITGLVSQNTKPNETAGCMCIQRYKEREEKKEINSGNRTFQRHLKPGQNIRTEQ